MVEISAACVAHRFLLPDLYCRTSSRFRDNPACDGSDPRGQRKREKELLPRDGGFVHVVRDLAVILVGRPKSCLSIDCA